MDKNKKTSSDGEESLLYKSVKANAIASKVKSIDGRILPRRYTTYQEPLKDNSVPKDPNVTMEKDSKHPSVKPSFASVLHEKPLKKVVKIKEMRRDERVNGAAVTLPVAAVEVVNARFTNTLYGYLIGNRLAFPLVENYGMESVLENGPWLIRLVPLILNEWTPNTILKKDEIKCAPVWVKLHHVPIVAYSEVGLSLITTQIGKPIMLDSYTSNMCLNSWGRSSYARALLEILADEEVQKSMVIAIPLSNKEGHTFATIDIEYEWTPPRCATCRVFDHVNEKCPKLPKVDPPTKEMDDGFVEVKKKKVKSKPTSKRQVEGETNEPTVEVSSGDKTKTTNLESCVNMANSFSALSEENASTWETANEGLRGTGELNIINDSDSEEVDEYITMHEKTDPSSYRVNDQGASTLLADVIYENKLSVCAILESHVADHNLDRMYSQVVHTGIWIKAERKELFCSFVYAHNRYIHRHPLWNGLCLHNTYVRNRPWCLLGDFNASLFAGDTSTARRS
ncbi:retrovirus-related pol polyprotein from transposon 17.6 [Tanacetum coccineum]|uniref:Retrovirus-related pol polyprotein from transposon 17.6 n=1 Tax=Tanacetum coccineum TaxID=301880 RepID=A0ABQ5CYD8_9ASTR